MGIESTHPWITFSLDLGGLSNTTWTALGECASKCEHLANTPLRPGTSKKLHEVYLAKGAQATTAIEGNTLTEEQVLQRVRGELRLPPSKKYLELEVYNIITACNTIGWQVREDLVGPIDTRLLCQYNWQVLCGLELHADIVPGQLRRHDVVVGRYIAPDYCELPRLVARFGEWLGELDHIQGDLDPVVVSILKAVLAHLYIAWIHPFGDGNGRTARLVEFDILLRSGVPTPAAHLLSNHYNQTRLEYYRQLELASINATPASFIEYAAIGFRDALREQLTVVNAQVTRIVWDNYVHEKLPGPSPVAHRRRHLVLDVSRQDMPVKKEDIPVLTARLRKHYQAKTNKTVARDLRALLELELLKKLPGEEFAANYELLDALLPARGGQDQTSPV